jgi:hypothetical protein
MIRALKIIFLLLITGSLFTSCIKRPEYPEEPIITFEDFIRFGNDSAWFIFSFTDGDGDVGLLPGETEPPYDYNFFMNYYEKQNGVFVKVDPDIPFSYRIPYLTPEGRIKTLEGEVIVRIPFIYFDNLSPYDTIKYDAYILDRSLKKSNVIETPEMVVRK